MNSDRAEWVGKVRDIYEKYEQGSPQFRLGLWRGTFTTPSYDKLFHPHEEHKLNHIVPTTVEGVQGRVCTKSYIAILGEEEQKKVGERIADVFGRGEARTWIDKDKGIFEYPYNTILVVMRRK